MIKFNQMMKFGLGKQSASFTGRESFRVDDKKFRDGLIALGVFKEDEPGILHYSGGITVPMKDGSERKVDSRGFLAAEKSDLKDEAGAGFL